MEVNIELVHTRYCGCQWCGFTGVAGLGTVCGPWEATGQEIRSDGGGQCRKPGRFAQPESHSTSRVGVGPHTQQGSL